MKCKETAYENIRILIKIRPAGTAVGVRIADVVVQRQAYFGYTNVLKQPDDGRRHAYQV